MNGRTSALRGRSALAAEDDQKRSPLDQRFDTWRLGWREENQARVRIREAFDELCPARVPINRLWVGRVSARRNEVESARSGRSRAAGKGGAVKENVRDTLQI